MASNTCWGIEIGAFALKAIKLERDGDDVRVLSEDMAVEYTLTLALAANGQYSEYHGNTVEPDESWSDWLKVSDDRPSVRSRFLQLRATLRNDPEAPSRLTGLSVAYRPLNRAPSIVRFDGRRRRRFQRT